LRASAGALCEPVPLLRPSLEGEARQPIARLIGALPLIVPRSNGRRGGDLTANACELVVNEDGRLPR
jgi:hypothetical protein